MSNSSSVLIVNCQNNIIILLSKSFEHLASQMNIPRVLITNNYVGRTVGQPNDTQAQTLVVEKALKLFEEAEKPNTVVRM